MMDNEDDINLDQALIPGIFQDKTNCRIHYAHVGAVFFTLILILIMTIVTSVIVSDVHAAATETREIIKDMNVLLPQARKGIEIVNILCTDVNFTTFYPRYAKVIC